MIRTFKKKDLMYLKTILATGRYSLKENRDKTLLDVCSYLSGADYREYAPHESGKMLINK